MTKKPRITTLSVKECSEFTGLGEQMIRIQLQRNILKFGTAIPSCTGKMYFYNIPISKVEEYMGMSYEEFLKRKEEKEKKEKQKLGGNIKTPTKTKRKKI